MKAISTIFAAALALVLQGAFAAANAANSIGHCTGMTVTDYVDSDATSNTTSKAWQNVTDAHMGFTTSATGCVAITLTAVGYFGGVTNSYEFLHVRTLLDGNNLCVPATYNDIIFSYAQPNSPAVPLSITRICKGVVPGTHTVQAQYHSGTGLGVNVSGPVLTVTHN